MNNKNEHFEQEFPKRLREQLYNHRKKLKLSQSSVANSVGKSPCTYQRWESSGKCLTDIFDLLRVFHALKFSTAEIIDVLGLPALTLSEMESIYQDEDLKGIKGNGIYSVMRNKCPDMDDFTLKKLIILLEKENLKRLENRN